MSVRNAAIVLAASMAVACAGNPGAAPTAPTGGTSPSTTVTMNGAWQGTASDSSGTMMGAGLTTAMMANARWTITQTGNSFTGTMQFSGYMGPSMMVSGTMNGHSGTFTMTAPAGSMMMMSSACTATATGTFDMDDMMTQFHGTYTGMNNCSGAFDHGQMSMHR